MKYLITIRQKQSRNRNIVVVYLGRKIYYMISIIVEFNGTYIS